ncbi:MAG: iron-containing alcohol dehydrogenase [Chloroflexi bacterium]|nr:iron-containing alcohol dehydrogenase [Chloroflexota bacterium]
MTGYRFSIPANIVYGIGELSNLGGIKLPCKTALVNTGGTSNICLGCLETNHVISSKFTIAGEALKWDRFAITSRQDLKAVLQDLFA